MTRRVLLIHNGRILAEGDVREIRDLMDEHPHTVALRARDPRALARAVVGSPHVLSLTFGAEGEWLTVQTARPDEFYRALPEAAVQAGVTEMYSPDEDLESVFKYLVARDEDTSPRAGGGAEARPIGRCRSCARARGVRPLARRNGLEPAQPADGGPARPAGGPGPGVYRCVLTAPVSRRASAASTSTGWWSRSTTCATCCPWPRSSTPPSLIADEVEGKTLTYLLTRPLRRPSILAGKFAAYLVTTLALALPAVVVTFFLLVPPSAAGRAWARSSPSSSATWASWR